METEKLHQKSMLYLKTLCEDIKNRSVGSLGNRQATDFFKTEITSFGWDCETSELDVIDWEDGGATLQSVDVSFDVLVSPYSLGCDFMEELTSISSIKELELADITGKIILLGYLLLATY
jgi:aminopeptidase YwaD